MKILRLAPLLLLATRLAVAAEPPAVGAMAPAFSLPSQDGTAVSLEQNRGK